MYLFKGEVKDLVANLEHTMKSQIIQKQLEVASDSNEYAVVINGVLCDYCGVKQAEEMMETSAGYDQAICHSCLEHYE